MTHELTGDPIINTYIDERSRGWLAMADAIIIDRPSPKPLRDLLDASCGR